MKTIDFTRIDNDTNGNPRYVCHFLNFISDEEQKDFKGITAISNMYELACKKAKTIGGKRYHTKV